MQYIVLLVLVLAALSLLSRVNKLLTRYLASGEAPILVDPDGHAHPQDPSADHDEAPSSVSHLPEKELEELPDLADLADLTHNNKPEQVPTTEELRSKGIQQPKSRAWIRFNGSSDELRKALILGDILSPKHGFPLKN